MTLHIVTLNGALSRFSRKQNVHGDITNDYEQFFCFPLVLSCTKKCCSKYKMDNLWVTVRRYVLQSILVTTITLRMIFINFMLLIPSFRRKFAARLTKILLMSGEDFINSSFGWNTWKMFSKSYCHEQLLWPWTEGIPWGQCTRCEFGFRRR